MRRLALLPLALAAIVLAPRASAAQASNVCSLVSQTGPWTSVGDPKLRVISANGPLLVRCSNGEELRADSAVIFQAQNEVQLFRRVDYEDPTRSLTSDQATYNSQTGRLYATGNVVFTDKQKGSTLRGPELEYYRQQPGRPQAQMTANQRPHVTIRPKNNGSAGANGQRRQPMEIDGDQVTMLGDRYMTATGNVVIVDNGTRSTTNEAFYDQTADHVELRHNSKVDNEKYHLTGDMITSDLKNGSVSKVVAQTGARLESERLTVNGPQLQLFFDRDLLQRAIASPLPNTPRIQAPAPAADSTPGRSPADSLRGTSQRPTAARPPAATNRQQSTAGSGAPGARPGGGSPGGPAASGNPVPTVAPEARSVAFSKGFRMEADSIEAILPEQQLKRVNAVGAAHGESWDTLAAPSIQVDTGAAHGQTPSATAASPATTPPSGVDQKDVLIADTIIAFFRQDSAKADSARGRRGADTVHVAGRPATNANARGDTAKTEIERLLALGNAHSLYRMRPDSAKGRAQPAQPQKPGLNYLVGDRIDLTFRNGEVDVAHVHGLKQGVYLDPDNGARRDSAGADSAKGGAARPGAAGARPGSTTAPAPKSPATSRPNAPTAAPAAPRSGTPPPSRPPQAPPTVSLAPAHTGPRPMTHTGPPARLAAASNAPPGGRSS